MSVVKHTTVHSLCHAKVGVVHFEVDNDPSCRYVNVWLVGFVDCWPTWNGLMLEDRKQNLFITGVARQIWNRLVDEGFTQKENTND